MGTQRRLVGGVAVAAWTLIGVACSGSVDSTESGANSQVSTTLTPATATPSMSVPSGTSPSTSRPEISAPISPTAAGTLAWAVIGEPTSLLDTNPTSLASTSAWTASWIRSAVLSSLFGAQDNGAPRPQLVAEEPEILVDAAGRDRERYRLRDGPRWSDGRTVTTRDVLFTLEIARTGRTREIVSTLGDSQAMDALVDAVAVSPSVFDLVWDPWVASSTGVLSTVLPAHQFSNDPEVAVDEVIEALVTGMTPRGPLVSSGPMILESWVAGSGMRLVRNPYYDEVLATGIGDGDETSPGVPPEVLNIAFVADEAAGRAALAEGRSDIVVVAEPSQDAANEESIEVLRWARDVQHVAEFRSGSLHLDVHGTRLGIAAILDRDRLSAVGAPGAVRAQSLRYAPWRQPGLDPATAGGLGLGDIGLAAQILADTGYRLDDDGILTHPFIGYLSIRVASAPGADPAVAAEIIDQLGSVGVLVEAVEDPDDADLVVHRLELDPYGRWPSGILADPTVSQGASEDAVPANVAITRRVIGCDSETREAWDLCLGDLEEIVIAGGEAIDDAVRWFPLRAESSALLIAQDSVSGLDTILDGPHGGPIRALPRLRALR